ncbi:MAG: methyltransferase domain-containing protein [Promethearchaeota archaeon]|nr:MAG: methyltransferase domain-containing protein [Candidatus Lokiarchaeota archaeon]
MLKRRDLQIISKIISPGSRVLDLGCGEGSLLKELINNKNITGLGIEISLERIKKCIEYGISVIQEDLNEGLKDFKDKSFDYVILSQTLADISKPVYLIKEMLRVGKKSIISFENLAYWRNRILFLFKGNLKESNYYVKLQHDYKKQQIFTISKFRILCELYNFKVYKEIYLPKGPLNLTSKFPNILSKTAIFILNA